MQYRLCVFYSLAFAIVLLAGCGKSESTVQGTVTFDGEPLPTGVVNFHPTAGGAVAYGEIQSDGSFTINTGKRLGLDAGEYTVTVDARESLSPELAAKMVKPRQIIPPRYSTRSTSGLSCTLEPGENQVNFDLSSHNSRR